MVSHKIKKKFFDLSIIHQAILTVFIGCIILSIFFVSYILQTNKVFEDANKAYAEDLVLQLEESICSNYESLKNTIYYISFQTDLQNFLLEEDVSQKYVYFNRINQFWANMTSLNPQIIDYVIIDREKSIYSLLGSEVELIPTEKIGSFVSVYSTKNSMNELIFVMCAPIKCTNILHSTNETIGYIYMILNKNALVSQSNTHLFTSNTYLRLTTEDGTCFWENRTGELSEQENLPVPTIQHEIKDMGIKIYAYPEQDATMSILFNTLLKYTLIFIFILLIVILLWVHFVTHTVRPIKELTDYIAKINSGSLKELSGQIELNGYLEIDTINNQFNDMLKTIKHLNKQVFLTTSQLYEAQLSKEKIDLQYLRSQINPHFLYNTLESLKGMAATSGDKEIVKFTKAVSSIFKYSLKGEAEVPLSEELKIIKSYIYIQHIRFTDRFCVEFNIQEDLLNCKLPKMILQPLVENAIVHGIEDCPTFCKLSISAVQESKKDLCICIFNEGIPIEAEKLKEIQLELKNSRNFLLDQQPKSIGLHNVHNRIQLTYGEPYGLSIESSLEGTFVFLRIPMKGGENLK